MSYDNWINFYCQNRKFSALFNYLLWCWVKFLTSASTKLCVTTTFSVMQRYDAMPHASDTHFWKPDFAHASWPVVFIILLSFKSVKDVFNFCNFIPYSYMWGVNLNLFFPKISKISSIILLEWLWNFFLVLMTKDVFDIVCLSNFGRFCEWCRVD